MLIKDYDDPVCEICGKGLCGDCTEHFPLGLFTEKHIDRVKCCLCVTMQERLKYDIHYEMLDYEWRGCGRQPYVWDPFCKLSRLRRGKVSK
jgi:hypothetical protein